VRVVDPISEVPSLQFERGTADAADGLDHKELLELDLEEGVIRSAGQRALLDAVAMGL
jgi:hypothetical protein